MTSTALASNPPATDTALPRLHTARGKVEIRAGETLLAALLRHGHPVEYQCRSGYCGACRLTVDAADQAKVHWLHTPLAHLRDGEVLACCCTLRGDVRLGQD